VASGPQLYAWGKLKVSGDNTTHPMPLEDLSGWNVSVCGSGGWGWLCEVCQGCGGGGGGGGRYFSAEAQGARGTARHTAHLTRALEGLSGWRLSV